MIRTFLLLFIALFLTNCSTKTLSPVYVADYFWVAEKNQNYEDAKRFVLLKDVDDVKLQENIKIRGFSFGKVEESEYFATVETKMHLEGIFSQKEKDMVEVDFDTKLEKSENGWKVDLSETKKELYSESAKKFSQGLGAEMFKKLKEGWDYFKELFSK